MAAAPQLIAGPNSPTPLPRRLLDVIPRFMVDNTPAGGIAWLNGVTWQPRLCDQPVLRMDVDVCANGDFVDPNYALCRTPIVQQAFSVWDVYGGPTTEYSGTYIERRLREAFALEQSWAFAKELIGLSVSGGQSLSSAAHAPADLAFSTPASSVMVAIGILEAELARNLRGGTGIIHLSPGMLGQAVENGHMEVVDGHWQTPLGHWVIADAGYVDAVAPTGAVASTAATEWIYSSGPVEYQSTAAELIDEDPNQRTDISTNKIKSWMASHGILIFDPCPVSAVLAPYTAT